MKNLYRQLFIIVLFIMCASVTKAQYEWTELGGDNSLAANKNVYTVCSDTAGNIYAAGEFTNKNKKLYIAKYNGKSWSEFATFPYIPTAPLYIGQLHIDNKNRMYAVGLKNTKGLCYVARVDSGKFKELAGLDSLKHDEYISEITSDKAGNIYVSGNFKNSAGKNYVAKWDGSAWSELGGFNGLKADAIIYTICSDTIGNIYAAGAFRNADSTYYVAKWDGSKWSELKGQNTLNAKQDIWRITSDVKGNIYATGDFTNSNGNYYIAKWDGNSWSELGGLDGFGSDSKYLINALCFDKSGNFYAGGNFGYIKKWDGVTWTVLDSTFAILATGMCNDRAGTIYAAGYTFLSDYHYIVARYGAPLAVFENKDLGIKYSVFPNPNSGTFKLDLSSKVNKQYYIQLKNMVGQTVLSEKMEVNQGANSKEFDALQLEKGMYFLIIADESGHSAIQKVIVQ